MQNRIIRRGTALLCTLLLLGGCGKPESLQNSVQTETEPSSAAETAPAEMTAEDTAYDTLTHFLDACIAGDMAAFVQYSDYRGAADEAIGKGGTPHAPEAYFSAAVDQLALKSYTVGNARKAELKLAQRCAEKAHALRSQADAYEAADSAAELMYPDYLREAADMLDTVTDGYLFEVTTGNGVTAEIPVLRMQDKWQTDIWVEGDLSDLTAGSGTAGAAS